MREVAERAGVAMSSVSRTLSGHPDVSESMRQRVLAAVEELGYKPDLLAQGLRSRTTRSIGFVAGDISNPLLARIVKGAEVAMREAGYSMLLTNSLVDPELDQHNIELLEQRRADGLIVVLVSEDHQPTIDTLAHLTIPLVVVDRDLPDYVNASRVVSDHRAGMTAATERLLELGHRRIGVIAGQAVRPTRERVTTIRATIARHGLDPDGLIMRAGVFSFEHGAQAMSEILDLPDPPTAVIAASNQIMIGALTIISQRRIELGNQLSFIGCDDLAVATLYRPQIAVIDRDSVAIGRAAAELALSQVRENAPARREVMLPTMFISRDSCGPAPDERAGTARGRAARPNGEGRPLSRTRTTRPWKP